MSDPQCTTTIPVVNPALPPAPLSLLTGDPQEVHAAWPAHHRDHIKVAALGGGHGLHATLEALRLLTNDVTAIVCVGDNGGSSGRLRQEFPGILPPGDIRMALSALASQEARESGVVNLLQHRFVSAGPLNGHSLGNLIMTAEYQRTGGDTMRSIRTVQEMLGIGGRVVPGASVALDLTAQVKFADGSVHTLTGQRNIAKTSGQVLDMHISPSDPPVFEEAVKAIEEADLVTLGPGSWYTSLLVHVMVPRIREALHKSAAKKILIMDLVSDAETRGLTLQGQLDAFARYSQDLPVDAIVAGPQQPGESSLRVPASTAVIRRRLNMTGKPAVHDRVRLAVGIKDACDFFMENASAGK